MAAPNVDLVRRSFEAFARGDFDTAFAAYGKGVEWCTAADEPDRQTYRGIAGVSDLVAALDEAWEDRFGQAMLFEDFIDCGDWVVVPWTARLRGKGSGVPIEVSETYAVRVESGRIVQVDEYRTRAEALDAVR